MSITHKKTNAGFTLIELMISITLGLLLSVAAVQLFITGLSSFNLQRGLGDVTENGRFVMDYISRDVRATQYATSTSAALATDSAVVAVAADLPGGTTAYSTSDDITTLGVGSSDQLVVRTWVPLGVNNKRDCEGNIVPPENYAVSRYFVRADAAANTSAALACDGGYYSPTAASVTNFKDDGVVLLSSVDSFQVMYGVAIAPVTSPATPIRYVNFTDYLAMVPQPVIVSLRMGALVRSVDSISTSALTTADMKVVDKVITASQVPSNARNYVRRVYSSTIVLRNAM